MYPIWEHANDRACLERVHKHTIDAIDLQAEPVLPNVSSLNNSRSTLLQKLPENGVGIAKTTDHLVNDISPALNRSSLSPNYYSFVTGGLTPAARVADGLVSLYDQNVHVHLPDQTIATNVEDRALRLLMELLHFDSKAWSGVFTTGATGSNVLGLACGREYIVNERLRSRLGENSQQTLGSLGLLQACRLAGIDNIHIYTTMAHSSLYKASSILGLGRSCVQDLRNVQHGVSFDFAKLEEKLAFGQHDSASIVVISCAEVNTGLFATSRYEDLRRLRRLCDKYRAWLHVDGAFGLFGRALQGLPEFETIHEGCAGLELADSITGDGHKLLNVPYDCGFFLSRDPGIAQQVFQNPNAAYLNTKDVATDIVQSPLNIGLENSRRFRGFPVYATLMAYGREGYIDILKRQVRFARSVAAYLFDHPAFELLPRDIFESKDRVNQRIFIIVLFRAKDEILNERLVDQINASGKMCVSGTVWESCRATRIAVSNWQVQPDRDILIVRNVLEEILKCQSFGVKQA